MASAATTSAIEVVGVPSERTRSTRARTPCSTSERRPAIVYIPTRSRQSNWPRLLSARFRGAPPTMPDWKPRAATRSSDEFLAGKLDVIVATIAFGMGDRQAEHPDRDSHRAAGQHGRVLPGDRPRGPRRRAVARYADALVRRTGTPMTSSSSAIIPIRRS